MSDYHINIFYPILLAIPPDSEPHVSLDMNVET